MSDIMEKTIASLPSLISGTLSGKVTSSSRAFQTFVKNLGNLKSKYEEEQFIKRELALHKQRLVQPGISSTQMREYLVRLVYCSMLGYDVSFAYIHAIKLAQQGTLIDKRAGYLVSAIFLNDSDELVMLLVNTIQKDLRSTNIACVSMALTAAGQLISQEMIPALLPLVEEKLKHPREVIRKKAVLCLLCLYTKAPELLAHTRLHLKAALCDSDPSVMWAALHFYHHLIQEDPYGYSELVPTLIGLLEQVLNRHLPSDFEYHSVPAPWLQILLMKMLAKLGQNNPKNSESMYGVLSEVLQRTEPSHKIGLAVIYECLETILTISPHTSLVEHAAKVVGKFLSSKSNNLRYLGIKALTLVVRIDAGYAVEHQEAVIDSLEHPDLTIRSRTLELLYQMANTQNRRVICERLLHHLSTATDSHMKVNIISKVIHLADKFSDDKNWFIATVNRAIVLGGQSSVPPGVCEKILDILPRGAEGDTDLSIQKFAVETYWVLLHHDEIPDVLLQVAAWVLGEFSSRVGELDLQIVVHHLVVIYERDSTSLTSRLWILSALIKLCGNVTLPKSSIERMRALARPEHVDLRQRLLELERLSEWSTEVDLQEIVKSAINDTSQDKDWSLSFLDDFVAESLEQGAVPYKPIYIRYPQMAPKSRDKNSLFAGLNFNPYESPRVAMAGPTSGIVTPSAATSLYAGARRDLSLNNSDGSIPPAECSQASLQMSHVKRVWSKSGIVPEAEKKEIELTQSDSGKNPEGAPSETSQQLESEASDTSVLEKEAEKQRRELASQLFKGITSDNLKSKNMGSYINDGSFQNALTTNASIDIAFHTTTEEHAPSITGTVTNQDQQAGHYEGQSHGQGRLKGQREMGQHQRESAPGQSAASSSILEPTGLRLSNSARIWTQEMLANVEPQTGPARGSVVGSPKGTLSSGSSNNGSSSSTVVHNSLSKSLYGNISPVVPINPDADPRGISSDTGGHQQSGQPSMYDDFNVTDYVHVAKDSEGDDVDAETPVMVSPMTSPQKKQCAVPAPEGTSVDLLAAADMLSPDNGRCFLGEEKTYSEGGDFIQIELPQAHGALSSQFGSIHLSQAQVTGEGGSEGPNELKDELFVKCPDLEGNKEFTSSSMGCREEDDGLSVDSLEHEQLDQGSEQVLSDFCVDLLPQGLKGFPHEPTASVGGRNNRLTLLYQKVWSPDKLFLLLTAFSSRPTELDSSEVKIDINVSSLAKQGMKSKVLTSEDSPDGVYPVLPSGYFGVVLELQATDGVLESPVVVMVNVQQVAMETPGAEEQPANLPVSLHLNVSDFVR